MNPKDKVRLKAKQYVGASKDIKASFEVGVVEATNQELKYCRVKWGETPRIHHFNELEVIEIPDL